MWLDQSKGQWVATCVPQPIETLFDVQRYTWFIQWEMPAITCASDVPQQAFDRALGDQPHSPDRFLDVSSLAWKHPRRTRAVAVVQARGAELPDCAMESRLPARRDQRGDSVDDHAVVDRRAVDGRPLRRD